VIAGTGYGTAFAATVAFPVLACALVPVRAERPLDASPKPRRATRRQPI